jgi:hypothetical protein
LDRGGLVSLLGVHPNAGTSAAFVAARLALYAAGGVLLDLPCPACVVRREKAARKAGKAAEAARLAAWRADKAARQARQAEAHAAKEAARYRRRAALTKTEAEAARVAWELDKDRRHIDGQRADLAARRAAEATGKDGQGPKTC